MSFMFKYLFKKIWGNSSTTKEVVDPPKTEDAAILTTEDAAILTTEDAAILTTEDAAILTTEDAAILTTEDAAILTTEDAAILTTEDAAILTTEDAAILTTEDAAILTTEDESLLNLFYNYNTNLDLTELLTKASKKSMLYTLKIIAHISKNTSNFHRITYEWLFQNHEKQLIANMQIFLEKYGNWDDLSHLPSDSESFKQYIILLSNNLKADLDNINNEPKARSACVTKSISSTANWVQQNKHIWPDVAKCLGINVKSLKKDYLKPLTKNLSLVDDTSIENNSLSEQIITFNLSHHEIMMATLSDSFYDDIKCVENGV